MSNFKTIVLVVLYGKPVSDSNTIKSLLKMNFKEFDVFIHNNGPKRLEELSLNLKKLLPNNYKYINDLSNSSLSLIYNNFIKNNIDYDRFVIFDDDTILKSEFFDEVNKDVSLCNDIHLQVPIIYENNNIHYPLVNDVPLSAIDSPLIVNLNKDKLFSIGSGLIIYKPLIQMFVEKNKNLFDERFVFYGVDVSLFRALNKDNFISPKKINILVSSSVQHSLSKNSKEKISNWRLQERVIDDTLSTILFTDGFFRKCYRLLKIMIKNSSLSMVWLFPVIIKVIIIRRHPRS